MKPMVGILCALFCVLSRPGFAAKEIEPRAADVLREMSRYLAHSPAFRFRIHEMVDRVRNDGRKVQFSNVRVVTTRRPDRLTAVSNGDLVSRWVWLNKGELTVYDPDQQVYSRLQVPLEIGAFFDFLAERMGMVVPLSELVYGDPYSAMMVLAETGEYLGLHTVDGDPCHHVLFAQPGIEWQAWIQAEGPPLPRKVVMNYVDDPARPQYIALIDQWDTQPEFGPNHFQPDIPKDATRIDMLPRGWGGRPPAEP